MPCNGAKGREEATIAAGLMRTVTEEYDVQGSQDATSGNSNVQQDVPQSGFTSETTAGVTN